MTAPSPRHGGARLPPAGRSRGSSFLLMLGAAACLTVLAFQFSVFAGEADLRGVAAKPGEALIHTAVSAVRALLSVPSAPFACEPIAAGSTAVLCESRNMHTAWADVSEACAPKRVGNASSHTRLLVMCSAAWLRLRIEAFSRGFPEGGITSSLLPVNTTLDPWDAINATRVPRAMWALRLQTAMSWQYEGRFDVLLNGTAVCRVARALATRGPGGGPARAAQAPPLVHPAAHVVGVSARETATSSFWDLVWRRSLETGGSVSVSWCFKPGASVTTQELCARVWVPPAGLKAGMESAQRSLFTRNASMILHDRGEAERLIPLSHARVASNTELLRGTASDNHTQVNVAFNPPDTMSRAGQYLLAYDMVITPSGGLQSRTGNKAARAVRGALNASGVALSPRRFLFHSTCEPDKLDQYPDKYTDQLPVHDEVVVITHRLEYNIYHWTTESMGKMAAMLDYLHANPHVKVHVGLVSKKRARESSFRQEHMKLLGLRWRKRVVQGYIRARVVHYVDNHNCGYPHGQWVLLLRERYRAALGLDNPPLVLNRAPGQRLLPSPPPAVAAAAAAAGNASAGAPPTPAPSRRPTIVVLRRGFSRRIANEDALLRRMRALLPEARVREVRDWQMPSQEEVFRRLGTADAIIGPHGAGQTNAIVARPGTCLMEFIPTEWFVLCYWRMSGHLDLDYNQFIAPGDRYAPMEVSVSRALVALRACMGLPPLNASAAAALVAADVAPPSPTPAAAAKGAGGKGGGKKDGGGGGNKGAPASRKPAAAAAAASKGGSGGGTPKPSPPPPKAGASILRPGLGAANVSATRSLGDELEAADEAAGTDLGPAALPRAVPDTITQQLEAAAAQAAAAKAAAAAAEQAAAEAAAASGGGGGAAPPAQARR